MNALGFALAALIGLPMGLLGGGGSILAVPIFVYVFGFAPKVAIAMSLAVVGATSLFGALGHWRSGNVNLRVALIFGTVAMPSTYLGARMAALVTGPTQLVLFAVVMLAAALFMLLGDSQRVVPATVDHAPASLVVAASAAVGLVTGVVGVGGGFLIVPALVLGRMPMKEAIGTSLLVIAMNAAAGFAGHVGQVDVPWAFMTGFTAVAVAGILAGTYLVRLVPQSALKRGFAVFLAVMSAAILYQNRDVLLPGHRRSACQPISVR